MARIFISYRREEGSASAGRLHDRLREHFGRDNVFMDVDTIEPGLDFVQIIERTVASCDVLIALMGRQWLSISDADGQGQRRLDNPEDFVRREIATALQRNIRVIPALIQGTPMPRATQLPEDLQPLPRRNALELSDAHFHRDVDGLIETLDRVLGMTRSPSSQAGTSGTTTPPSASTRIAPLESALVNSLKRPLRVGGILCLILGIFFFLWYVEDFPDYFTGQRVRSPIFLGLGIILMVLSAIIGRRGKA